MSLVASVGQGVALDGREAGAKAIRQAMAGLGHPSATLGLVFASHHYSIQHVLSGMSPVGGDTPMLGFSTSHELTGEATQQRSVVVALLAGESGRAQAAWWPDFTADSRAVTANLKARFQPWDHFQDPALLLVVDGLGGDFESLRAQLPQGAYPLGGCLAGGSLQAARTYQIGGTKTGSGGLAAALLSGGIKIGMGSGHGWQAVGPYVQVTRSEGLWVRELDGRPAAEMYAHWFGQTARDWSFPPLNELVRLYPLGLEADEGQPLQVRSPLRVEADGSLRMSMAVPEGSTCHLLVGSSQACQEAARQAVQSARQALGGTPPALGIALVDIAWQRLLEGQPGLLAHTLRAELGEGTPLAGGFTFGQFQRAGNAEPPELLNQHLVMVLFGD